MAICNINVGLLGHVDSGKTSLAKCLSAIASTACFDKNPQSQERGITLDLGFSSLTMDVTHAIKEKLNVDHVQFTFVDCPGHASLIKTIIGGVQIIDMAILVIDINKGIQNQTAECLILAEIIKKPLIVAFNKIDQISSEKRATIIEKATKKLTKTLSTTTLGECPIIPVSAINPEISCGISDLKNVLINHSYKPERNNERPLLFAVDHCFAIKGKGTVLTGNVLQGTIKINDNIEIPALKITKKVKSMQIFHKDTSNVTAGDRCAVCVTQFNPKSVERGLVTAVDYLKPVYAAILRIKKIKYYKNIISAKSKMHLSIGYETILNNLTYFNGSEEEFNFQNKYGYTELLPENEWIFAFIKFENVFFIPDNSLIIGSKLDVDINTEQCRIAFFGKIVHRITDKDYEQKILPDLKIYKIKEKYGFVQRIVNENEIIVQDLFKKNSNLEIFKNLNIKLETGETGKIQGGFGQSGKIKVQLNEALNKNFIERFNNQKSNNEKINCKVCLKFKKFIFDVNKKVFQDYLRIFLFNFD